MKTGRDERIYEEAVALWRALYGEPPPQADGATMLGLITGRLPMAGYERLASPHIRPATLAFPKSRRA